jgi:hypothetical protein
MTKASIQGVTESCTDILTTKPVVGLHAELGKNI